MSASGFAPLLLAAFAFVSVGCGEKPAVTVYKQGTYQGKPDNLPWESQPFAGNQATWEKSIEARTRYQNEYPRIQNQ